MRKASMAKPTRKEFLKLGLAGGVALALPFGASGCSSGDQTGALLRSSAPLPEPFSVPLPVPPVLEPVRTEAGTDYYELTQREGRAKILPGLDTTVWGYDGSFPGPTIEAQSGRRVVVLQRNELPAPTVVHLHGGVTPPESDGYPTDLILPADGSFDGHEGHSGIPMGRVDRGTKEYVYPIDQPAATLWYHDHRMDFTGPQVYKGLAGFHIVHDEVEDDLPLPKGEKDVPVMICDRAFDEDGSFLYPSVDLSLRDEPGVEDDFMEGVLADTILVNGAPWPFMEVSNTMYRFRILNASNARRYELELDPPTSGGDSFIQVGSDVGLLSVPVSHERIPIAPAERFDVVIDFSEYAVGTEVTLKNRIGEGSTAQLMRFRVVRAERDNSSVPDRLAAAEPIDPNSGTETRRFRFHRADVHGRDGWVINEEPFHPELVSARARLGSTEIWEVRGNTHHPIHLHLARFQVLSRSGWIGQSPPRPQDTGWKDTVDLLPDEEVRLAVRFDGYRGKYVFHCHNLEHEDMMMMANFEVV
jgi:spore coat protein A, manganese oxidase